jgi:hypothetical protein
MSLYYTGKKIGAGGENQTPDISLTRRAHCHYATPACMAIRGRIELPCPLRQSGIITIISTDHMGTHS